MLKIEIGFPLSCYSLRLPGLDLDTRFALISDVPEMFDGVAEPKPYNESVRIVQQ